MTEAIAPITMAFIFGLVLLEVFLSGRWNPTYFRKGIRIFAKTYQRTGAFSDSFESETLTNCFKGWFLPPFIFKEIGPDEYAFREGLFQFVLLTYTPIMHGILQIDRTSGMVTVVGHLNWVTLTFVLVCAALGCTAQLFICLPLFAVIAVLYTIQAYRFHRVGKVVTEWRAQICSE